MTMFVSDSLFFNIVKDWEKKQIPTEERSEFIKMYLEQTGMSERALAKQLGISHSTMHDWISGRQMKKYYERKYNEIYFMTDRLIFLLSKDDKKLDEKTLLRIKELKGEIEKVIKK